MQLPGIGNITIPSIPNVNSITNSVTSGLTNAAGGALSGVTGSLSGVVGGALNSITGGGDGSATNVGGMITQSERLFTVRSRGFAYDQQEGGSRGTRARIRILPSDKNKSLANRANVSFGQSAGGLSNPVDKLFVDDAANGFSDFILTDVNVSFNEKVQITQTFGDTETVYYFGKQPVIYNLSGILIDDIDNQWFSQFIETYGAFIRGTESARNFELVEITLPNVQVLGTVMGFNYSQNSGRDTDISFSLQVHAKSIVPLPVKLPGSLPTNAASLIDFAKASGFTTFAEINQVKDTLAAGVQAANDAVNKLDILNARNAISAGGAILSGGSPSSTTSPAVFNNSIFSPVFGVLTTITKIIKDVTGDISKIISSFTNPVNTILRDIQTIAGLATGIAKAVQAGVNNIVNGPLQTLNQIRSTIIALENAAGVISHLPETVAQSIKRLAKFGNLSTSAAFLTGGGTKPGGSTALLLSGAPYNPATSGTLRG